MTKSDPGFVLLPEPVDMLQRLIAIDATPQVVEWLYNTFIAQIVKLRAETGATDWASPLGAGDVAQALFEAYGVLKSQSQPAWALLISTGMPQLMVEATVDTIYNPSGPDLVLRRFIQLAQVWA